MVELSVIIPTFSVREPLEACLRSLLDQTIASDRYEILVVNNGGAEHARGFLEPLVETFQDSRIRVVDTEGGNLGYAGGCCLGVEESAGEFLVFFNDDAIADPAWLALARAEWKRCEDLGVVTCRIVDAEGPRLQHEGAVMVRPNALFWQPGYGCPDRVSSGGESFSGVGGKDLEFFSGCVWGTPKSVWNEVGGLSTLYHPGYYEDTEYGLRCRQLGYRIRLLATVTCSHYGSQTLGHASRKYWIAFHRSRYLFMLRNYLGFEWGEILRAELGWWWHHGAGHNPASCFLGFLNALPAVPAGLASRFRFRRRLVDRL